MAVREQTMTMLLKGMPMDLQRTFKALCAKRGISMKRRIVELMAEEVKRGHRELNATNGQGK